MLPLLVDCALRATLLLLAAAGISLALCKSSAARRHLLWTAAFMGLLALPLLSQVLPAWHIVPQFKGAPSSDFTPRAVTGSQFPMSNERSAQSSAPVPSLARTPASSAAGSLAYAAGSAVQTTDPSVAFSIRNSLFTILPVFYLAGVAVCLLGFLFSVLTLLRMRKTNAKLSTPEWSHLLADLSRQLGLTHRVTLLQSKIGIMPMTWSLGHSYILLPVDASDWSAQRRRCVLLHELAHLRRRDTATLLLARVTCCLYWFHPFAWLAGVKLRNLAEHAADDLVLAHQTKSTAYAEQLLAFGSAPGARPRPQCAGAAIAMARGGSQLKWRIKSILNPAQNRKSLTRLSCGAALLCMAVLVFPLACARERTVPAKAASSNSAFPHLVRFNLGQSQFLSGDRIAISEIRGTADTIAPGNTYQIKGTYTLSSHNEAILYAYVTSAGPSGIKHDPEDLQQSIPIDRGSGGFTVVLPFLSQGYPHLSFYPAIGHHTTGGSSFGALYFGAGDSLLNTAAVPIESRGSAGASTNPAETSEQVEAVIDKLGGKVGRDEKAAGRPVIFVNLRNTRVTDAELGLLPNFGELHFLQLDHTKITDAGLEKLAGLKELQILHLGGTRITSAGLEHLKDLGNLWYLELVNDGITDAGLAHLKDMKSLRILALNSDPVTDAGLAYLKDMTHLQNLGLSKTGVTDAGMAQLAALTDLQDLDISGTKITDAGLEHLKGRATMQSLNLADTQISDAGLAHLQNMKGLGALWLRNLKVTDAGLVNLKNLTGLKLLDLANTEVTDVGLEQLKGMKALHDLDLTGTKVSAEGLRHLQAVLPSCSIRGRKAD